MNLRLQLMTAVALGLAVAGCEQGPNFTSPHAAVPPGFTNEAAPAPYVSGDAADPAFEAVLAVVDDVIGAEACGVFGFLLAADGGDDGAADGFGDADGDAADARPAGVHQHPFLRFQLRVVEQHVLDRAIGDRDAGGIRPGDVVRYFHA